MKVWTPEEADAFLLATREHRMHALYVLALTTGMRQGELLGLKWADIDLNAGTLAVRRALQWQRGIGWCSRNRRRRAPAARFTSPESDRRAARPQGPAGIRPPRRRRGVDRTRSGVLQCHWRTAHPTNETKRFSGQPLRAGLPAIRFHDLRHTAATILLAKGVHVKLVSEMLGHSSIVLTLDTYSPRHPGHARRRGGGDGCGVRTCLIRPIRVSSWVSF